MLKIIFHDNPCEKVKKRFPFSFPEYNYVSKGKTKFQKKKKDYVIKGELVNDFSFFFSK